jgi:hypothetical protein
MALEQLSVFLVIRRTNQNGTTGGVYHRYQNGRVGDSLRTNLLSENGATETFDYLPFIYQGGTINRTGDNITAGLGLAVNKISLTIATEMTQTVEYQDNSEVRPMTVEAAVVLLDDNFKPSRVISREYWIAAAMSYTVEELEIVLSSAIDAVNALAPNYSLDRQNVGSLPISGNVRM